MRGVRCFGLDSILNYTLFILSSYFNKISQLRYLETADYFYTTASAFAILFHDERHAKDVSRISARLISS